MQTYTNQSSVPTLSLTEDEVRRLIEDKSSNTLLDVTRKIGRIYTKSPLSDGENQAAEQIFRLLMRDTEERVRVALAEQVKNSPSIPRDIVLTLAHDVEAVALPILQYSEVLGDEDLLELISGATGDERCLAISSRDQVSAAICDTLLRRDNEAIAAALVSNSGADITEESLNQVMTRYKHNHDLLQSVGNRPHLPVNIAEKLVTVVSSNLAHALREKYHLPDIGQNIEQEIEKTRESETLRLIRNARSPEDIDRLVNQLHGFERLTPSIILSALCQGNFEFFEISLARLSGIPVANARTLINDRGELGFRAIYNKSGLTETMFPAVRLLLKTMHELDCEGMKPGSIHYTNRIIELLLQYSAMAPVENLSYIIALIRRAAQ